MIRVAVGKLDPGLLAPKQVGDETDKAGLREFVCVMAHGVVDAPDFHDRNDGAGGHTVGDREISAHFPVAELHRDVLGFHFALYSFSSVRALPARIRFMSGSASPSPRTPSNVSAIKARPRSGSNGASVANKQCDVPKKAWPQRVGAFSPPSAV